MRPGSDRATTGRLLSVHEAADELGITVEAVRSRLKRGTLQREKGDDGTTYVVVEDRPGDDRARQGDDGADARAQPGGDRSALLYEHMAGEISHLREQLAQEREASAELRRIVAGLVQRVPELEAPSEPRESSETPSEEPGRGGVTTSPEEPQRGFWRKLFGV